MRYDSFDNWRFGARAPWESDDGDDLEAEAVSDPDLEEEKPDPQPCACEGEDWIGCDCQEPEDEEDEYSWLDLVAELERLRRLEEAERNRPDRDWRHAA